MKSLTATKMSAYAFCTALLAMVASGAYAGSAIQTVTNTNDSGAGSLRAAINAANSNGVGGALITFNISDSCGPSLIHL